MKGYVIRSCFIRFYKCLPLKHKDIFNKVKFLCLNFEWTLQLTKRGHIGDIDGCILFDQTHRKRNYYNS